MIRTMVICGVLGATLLLGACGGSGDEPEPQDTAEPAAPAVGVEPSTTEPGDADPAEGAMQTDAAEPGPARGGAARAPDAGPAGAGAPPARPAGEQQLTGRVTVTGSEPRTFVMLQPAEGASVRLVGALEPELRRLSGAVVTVTGRSTDAGPPARAFEVATYELVEIDGQRPFVGTLEVDGDSHQLVGQETLRLEGVPVQLAERSGATIWVVGPREGDLIRVQSYGVIRP